MTGRAPVPAGRLLGRLGRYEVRLAATAHDLDLAQRLRWRVFRAEEGAAGSSSRDEDRFDAQCDHLLLVDTTLGHEPERGVVGTYRLLTPEGAARAGGFYAQAEFDVKALIARHEGRRFLELGRSCVLPESRSLRTMELLWHGVWAYVLDDGADVLFGCASLPGTNAQALCGKLAFLRENARAPDAWQTRAAPGRGVALPEGGPGRLTDLPPLVKGYLRLGGRVCDESVVDPDFGTTDVLLVLAREWIAPRYLAHYGAAATRFA